MSKTDMDAYLRSIGAEMLAQSTRVRDLIGSRHWGTDGNHMEAVASSVLSRFLPARAKMSKGFILGTLDAEQCSLEQDLLIYDDYHEAPLFNQSGVSIIHSTQALASISVKATLTKAKISDSLDNLHSAHYSSAIGGNHKLLPIALFFSIQEDLRTKERQLSATIHDWYESCHAAGNLSETPFCAQIFCLPDIVFRVTSPEKGNIDISGYYASGCAGAVLAGLISERLSNEFGGTKSHLNDCLDSGNFSDIGSGKTTWTRS